VYIPVVIGNQIHKENGRAKNTSITYATFSSLGEVPIFGTIALNKKTSALPDSCAKC
jgi:hypothetical protein